MNSPLEHARALLARAEDDFYVVRRLHAEADAPGWVLGFHAQQAVEKALKAVLSSAGLPYPRTHNLVMLSELLRSAGVALPPDVDAFGGLTPYGVALRYDEVFADAPAPAAAGDFEGIVMRTLAWAKAHLHLPQG